MHRRQAITAASAWIVALRADLEPLRVAIAAADEPEELPCFLGQDYEAMYPDGVPLPDRICVRTGPIPNA